MINESENDVPVMIRGPYDTLYTVSDEAISDMVNMLAFDDLEPDFVLSFGTSRPFHEALRVVSIFNQNDGNLIGYALIQSTGGHDYILSEITVCTNKLLVSMYGAVYYLSESCCLDKSEAINCLQYYAKCKCVPTCLKIVKFKNNFIHAM